MRRSLSLLLLAGLLPVVALGGTFGAISLRDERRTLRNEAQLDAQFAASLLAVRLEASARAVGMIAQSPAFDRGIDLDRFRILGPRIVANQPDWRSITIATADGTRIVDVPEPIATSNRRAVDSASLEQVIRTGHPVVGNIVTGPHGRQAFAIRAPVLRDGKVRYVVSAIIRSERLRQLLAFRSLPTGWSMSLVDGAGHVVRVPDQASGPRRAYGSEASASVPGTNWFVHTDAPAHSFSKPLQNATMLIAAAALGSALLIAALARMLAADLAETRRRQEIQVQGQRMEALGHLTGGVAHDFNNLLTPILAGFDMIARKTDDDRLRRYAEAGLASGERAKALVERLLVFSRQQPLRPEAIDVASLLAGMEDLIRGSITRAIVLTVTIGEDLCAARADRTQLELAILNLVINAKDAMPDGGQLSVAASRASAGEHARLPTGAYVRIEVEDTGSGMPEEVLRRAVDPFYTTKAVGKGTGLGLSMVDGFAAQSGGALHLSSTPGRGTRATIFLPCIAKPAPIRAPAPVVGDLPSHRILLVDDDEAVRLATTHMLEEAGQQVVQVSSAEEAIKQLQRGEHFDAVFTDFVMPGRSGGDLVAWVHANGSNIPVLVMSGFADAIDEIPEDVPRLMKPFGSAALVQALQSLMRPQQMQGTL